MIDTAKLISIIIESGAFVSTFAAIVAGAIMLQVTKKIDTGILAKGFKTVSVGVIFLAFGILIDTIQTYFQISQIPYAPTWLLIFKDFLFVVGTYVIVIGVKTTGDKLENLTK